MAEGNLKSDLDEDEVLQYDGSMGKYRSSFIVEHHSDLSGKAVLVEIN